MATPLTHFATTQQLRQTVLFICADDLGLAILRKAFLSTQIIFCSCNLWQGFTPHESALMTVPI